MQIIVISDRLANARTLTLSTRHVFASAIFGLATLTGLTIGLYWLTLRFAADVKVPYVQQMMQAVNVQCPFLLDGACSVYDGRPFSCRAVMPRLRPYRGN